jgi:hypothetical protein
VLVSSPPPERSHEISLPESIEIFTTAQLWNSFFVPATAAALTNFVTLAALIIVVVIVVVSLLRKRLESPP